MRQTNSPRSFGTPSASLAPTIMEETQSDSIGSDNRSLETAESLRALREQADHTLDDHRQSVSEVETRLTEQLQIIADEVAQERLADEKTLALSVEQAASIEELQHSITAKETEVLEVLEQLAAQSQSIETQLQERDEELELLLDLGETENQEREVLQQELVMLKRSLEQLESQECVACVQVGEELLEATEQLEQLKQQLDTLQEQHKQQQTDLDVALAASQTAQENNNQASMTLAETEGAAATADGRASEAEESLSAAEAKVSVAERRVADVEKLVADAEKRIVELEQQQQDFQQNSEDLNTEIDQTRRKFELALADVQQLKKENSELQSDLQSRPEASDQESPELVSLRVERDALADRVSELEAAPVPTVDEDAQQVLEDLQLRFELAVDDVRELKQENAVLRQSLETAASAPETIINDEPLDWQAQKALLLASLEAEDSEVIEASRQEERATIKETILATDRIVAEKEALLTKRDGELADLREQLESRPEGVDIEALREQIAEEILGDDQAIVAARAKLQARQQELDDALRDAELKISIERATFARDQAELKEKLAAVEELVSDESAEPSGKPRRRWLSALGLKDDKDDNDSAG